MFKFSWNSTSLNFKTGIINNYTLFTLKAVLVQTKYYICGHPHQRGWSNLIPMHCRKEKNRGCVSEEQGHAILFMDRLLQKGTCNALNQCMFIYKTDNPQNRFELLSGNQNLSSQKKRKQRRGDKIGSILWNSSWKPCFSKGNTESLTNAMAHESLSTCQTNHSSKNPSPNWDCEYICIFSTLRED